MRESQYKIRMFLDLSLLDAFLSLSYNKVIATRIAENQ